jgi:hypothetical protein
MQAAIAVTSREKRFRQPGQPERCEGKAQVR